MRVSDGRNHAPPSLAVLLNQSKPQTSGGADDECRTFSCRHDSPPEADEL
jgi:hypothetical protein